ncbi:alpha/beta hydrolase [Bombiscardovia nodaiensis]|uniref:Alpha/beta hydrolase n=1 Tax=Bombiscardovia nodaiensis TaxID=2932181 RepID=A0ABM8B601_9BIFI|nr:alpha/beta hydrolase [Bombiscardovia nodaiensis]
MPVLRRVPLTRDEFGRPLPRTSSRLYSTRINGARIVFSMNPAPASAPILLYLHGGPGDACIPLTERYNAGLERHFRFINFDQRGCGLSYYPFGPSEHITIDLMLADLLELVRRLKTAYPQAPITLLGHSWGSVLGLEFASRYPQLIRRYIGVGQVVSMPLSHRVRSHPLRGPLPAHLRRLFSTESDVADLLLRFDELKGTGGWLSLWQDVVRSGTYVSSRAYGWQGVRGLLLGAHQSHAALDAELDQVDFTALTHFAVPVCFVEGRHDRHLPGELVQMYADTLTSPHYVAWFEHSAHCPQWEEPARFCNLVTQLCQNGS